MRLASAGEKPRRVKRKKAARKQGAAAKPKRKNLRGPERERGILEAAIRFFAEHGFEGQTRELAKRIGVTHSAIYRHFPSKEVLVERVYQHVYLDGWQKHWGGIIADRSQPLEARLSQFYCEYAERIFNYDWVRIFMFSGLKSFDINERYLQFLMDTIGTPALTEARLEFGLPSVEQVPISQRERELFWGLHGRFFYIAIRKFVYGTRTPEEADYRTIIDDGVRQFLFGARSVLQEIVVKP